MGLQFLSIVLLLFHSFLLVSSVNDEGLALLAFKQNIENPAEGRLDSWNPSDANPCLWHGITCKNDKVDSLVIAGKRLTGFLYLDGGKLGALRRVNLRNNNFSGNLPGEVFGATELESLALSGNSFSGEVPPEIGNIKSLHALDLSQNSFSGSLPETLLQCKRLKKLILSQNKFTGSLPDAFGSNLVMLRQLNLSFNNFTGLIPSSLGNLSNLQKYLDLSHNLFNGNIPESLGSIPQSVYINLACNNLSGRIPQNGPLLNLGPPAFIGNPFLCGPPLKTPCPDAKPIPRIPSEFSDGSPGKNKKGNGRSLWVVAVVAGAVVGICLITLSISYWYRKVRVSKGSKRVERSNFEEKSMVRKDMFCFRTDDLESLSEQMEQYTFVPLDSKVSFDLEQLLKASAFLLGRSSTGIIYRVILEKGLNVAVRRLEDGGCQRLKEFQTEVEAIGKIRHPNIVSLLAYCWCINEKLLIYDYMPNGNLATAIHGRTGMTYLKPLSWSARLRIMKGVAKGLAFLHEFSPKRYVHGNLKPSNILLDENMEPRISDFGLGRLVYTSEESLSVHLEQAASGGTPQQDSPYALTPTNSFFTGSYYMDPEASKSTKPSQKWDIYSFGVILLEMISGKLPLTGSSGMDLVRWVQLSIEVKPLSDVLDPFLTHELDKVSEMVALLKIALDCVHASPDKRPSMRNVSFFLDRLPSI